MCVFAAVAFLRLDVDCDWTLGFILSHSALGASCLSLMCSCTSIFILVDQHLAQWRARWSGRALHPRRTDLGIICSLQAIQ